MENSNNNNNSNDNNIENESKHDFSRDGVNIIDLLLDQCDIWCNYNQTKYSGNILSLLQNQYLNEFTNEQKSRFNFMIQKSNNIHTGYNNSNSNNNNNQRNILYMNNNHNNINSRNNGSINITYPPPPPNNTINQSNQNNSITLPQLHTNNINRNYVNPHPLPASVRLRSPANTNPFQPKQLHNNKVFNIGFINTTNNINNNNINSINNINHNITNIVQQSSTNNNNNNNAINSIPNHNNDIKHNTH